MMVVKALFLDIDARKRGIIHTLNGLTMVECMAIDVIIKFSHI